jgi:hypothetical protein
MHKQFLQQNCLIKYGQSHNYNLFPYFYIFWKQSYVIKTHNYNLGQNQFPGRQLSKNTQDGGILGAQSGHLDGAKLEKWNFPPRGQKLTLTPL